MISLPKDFNNFAVGLVEITKNIEGLLSEKEMKFLEGTIRVFLEDVLLSKHFGLAGICGSIGWSQYFKDSNIGWKFKHPKIKLYQKLSRLLPYSVLNDDIKGFTKIKYKVLRSRISHRDANPSK